MKIKSKLTLMELASLVILALAIVLLSNKLTTNALEERILNTLEIAVDGYTDDVNAFKDHGVDFTVFEGDMRVDSSIANAVGTTASQEVVDIVSKEGSYFDENVDVNGERFYGYYQKTDTGMLFAGRDYNELHSDLAKVSYILIGVTIVFLLACAVIVSFIASKIAKPIIEVNENVKKIADGDLTVEFEVKNGASTSNDEVLSMQVATNHMASQLRNVIGNAVTTIKGIESAMQRLNSDTDVISASASDISNGISEVSGGAVSQANETQRATELVSAMGENVADINSDTEKLMETAKAMEETKDNVLDTLRLLEISNKQILEDVDDTNKQINITNDSVEEMRKMIEMIKDIASQTNLLSLNASIEAAHAGDAGRGFAIVAEEIRKLAEQTAKSSDEIELTLKALLENYALIISNMQATTANVTEQSDKLVQTKDAFNTLEADINQTMDKIESVNIGAEELNKAREEVVDVITNLSAISEENAASAEEITASTEELASTVNQICENVNGVKDQAEDLLRQVELFKV